MSFGDIKSLFDKTTLEIDDAHQCSEEQLQLLIGLLEQFNRTDLLLLTDIRPRLSDRLLEALEKAKITTLGELTRQRRIELSQIAGIDKSNTHELDALLERLGYQWDEGDHCVHRSE